MTSVRLPLPDRIIITDTEYGDVFDGTWIDLENTWCGMPEGGDPDDHVRSFADFLGNCTYTLEIDPSR